MSKRSYPHIKFYRSPAPHGKHPQCKVCKKLDADAIVEVQWNWFRGDDDTYRVHYNCWAVELAGLSDEQKLEQLGANP